MYYYNECINIIAQTMYQRFQEPLKPFSMTCWIFLFFYHKYSNKFQSKAHRIFQKFSFFIYYWVSHLSNTSRTDLHGWFCPNLLLIIQNSLQVGSKFWVLFYFLNSNRDDYLFIINHNHYKPDLNLNIN